MYHPNANVTMYTIVVKSRSLRRLFSQRPRTAPATTSGSRRNVNESYACANWPLA